MNDGLTPVAGLQLLCCRLAAGPSDFFLAAGDSKTWKDGTLLQVPMDGIGPHSCAFGPYEVDHLDVQELLVRRRNSQFASATIYFPSKEGSERPAKKLASVVIVSGWGSGENSMAAWGPFYASHGILAMTIGTWAPFQDGPPQRSRALLDAVELLRAEDSRPGSLLQGRLDVNRIAVQGYSLGGGGCQLAVLENSTLKCCIALSPHDGRTMKGEQGKGLPSQLTMTVPVLFVVGEKDRIAPAQEHAWPQYHRTRSPKLILEVKAGNHAVANGPSGGSLREFLGSLGFCKCLCGILSGYAPLGTFNGSTGAAKPHAPNGAIGGMALAWLRLFLEGDESYRPQLQVRPDIASGFAHECLQVQHGKDY